MFIVPYFLLAMQVPPELNKELILSTLTQEEIFAKFGLEVTNKPIRNPFRKDKKPSCYFYINGRNKMVYFVDHAIKVHWDCFNYIMYLYDCSFYASMIIIANKFNLSCIRAYTFSKESKVDFKEEKYEKVIRDNIKKIITFKYRGYREEDLLYWIKYEIEKETLIKYRVYPIDILYVNDEHTYTYQKNDLCFAYHLGDDDFKVYFPLRTNKWLSNCDKTVIQGYRQLADTGDLVFITKSLKDVMCLDQLGYSAVAPQSESNDISDLITELQKRFTHVILFYDNDDTGIAMSYKYGDKFNIPVILTPDKEQKDISDFIEMYGSDSAMDFIEQTLSTL